MNKNLIVVGILAVLVIISAAQAVQLIGMNSDINEIDPTKSSGTTSLSTSSSTTSSSGSGSVPTNLQNLPGMVGGC